MPESGLRWRRRRVRFSYPDSLRILAVSLSANHAKRKVADLLDLPLTTVYRWATLPADTAALSRNALNNETLSSLVDDCKSHGFDVQKCVDELLPGCLQEKSGVVTQISVNATDGEISTTSTIEQLRNEFRLRATPPIHDERASEGLRRTRECMEMEYYKRWSCTRLAEMAGMSRWHYIKSFKAAFGQTPYHYLSMIRIDRAKQLLRTTFHSLDTIATAVGFDSCSSMSRCFNTIEGARLTSFYLGRNIEAERAKYLHL